MHSNHADVHEVGLVDGCPECELHAEQPTVDLDPDMLRGLLARTLDHRFRDSTVGPRSTTEAVAMASVLTILERTGKLAEVAPEDLGWYLVERWRVHCYFVGSHYRDVEAQMTGALPDRPDAQARMRLALRGYLVRRGEGVEYAAPEEWLDAAAELLNDLAVALGDACPPLDALIARSRRLELEP